MISQLFTIGILMLFSAMLPGPDFALVTKNTLLYSRRAGLFTSFGIAGACLVHITYCTLGLALVISQSLLIFSIIRYIGAAYLIYLGVTTFRAQQSKIADDTSSQKMTMSNLTAFKQGVLCNLLNPKATIFFLALFTVIIKPNVPMIWSVIYAIEMIIIITTWFSTLTFILSHPRVLAFLNKAEKYIAKIVGLFLIGFGVGLAFF